MGHFQDHQNLQPIIEQANPSEYSPRAKRSVPINSSFMQAQSEESVFQTFGKKNTMNSKSQLQIPPDQTPTLMLLSGSSLSSKLVPDRAKKSYQEEQESEIDHPMPSVDDVEKSTIFASQKEDAFIQSDIPKKLNRK